MKRIVTKRTVVLTAIAASAATLLVGCSSDDSGAAASQADSFVVSEQWVKAIDSGMTAAFAELRNDGDADIHVVGATSPASSYMELHEMATGADGSMVMRPKDGGFVIPAGGTHSLGAGGDHLMLMDVTEPLTPGSEAEFTVQFEDDSSATFVAQVRDFAGAQENYEPGAADMQMTPSHGG